MTTPNEEKMNARLRAHDTLMQASDLKPEEQMGVLIMATVLACRRVLQAHGIIGGQKRKLVRDAAVREFTNKLRKYTMPGPAVEETAEPVPVPVADSALHYGPLPMATPNEVRADEEKALAEHFPNYQSESPATGRT